MKVTKATKIEKLLPYIGALNPCDDGEEFLCARAHLTVETMFTDVAAWYHERWNEEAWTYLEWLELHFSERRTPGAWRPGSTRRLMRRYLAAWPVADVVRELNRLVNL